MEPVENLWEMTKARAGIDKDYYDTYFFGKAVAYAIQIKSAKKYKIPKCLWKDFNIRYPPQSFIYI